MSGLFWKLADFMRTICGPDRCGLLKKSAKSCISYGNMSVKFSGLLADFPVKSALTIVQSPLILGASSG
jgi:hypothetical protein